MLATPHAVTRTLTRCRVCGSSEVRTDEVVDHGLVLLHECPRCEFRWTARVQSASVIELPRSAGEVPAAA